MKRKVSCFILTSILILYLLPFASAVSSEESMAAESLYELELFRGTGINPDGTPIFDLYKAPTRNQAVIMLVRLLGKEQDALSGTWEVPFTDVARGSAVYPYIGYAYANGLAYGTTLTTFSGQNPIRANQYITFVLRALGYESGQDFEVSTAWTLSDELGITNGEYNAANASSFIRANVADISFNALSAVQKGSTKTLAEKLIKEDVFTKEQYLHATNKTPEVTPEGPKEEPFTRTAFGDKWLHEYLMSLNPSSAALGPTRPAFASYFDQYYYTEEYIADEIISAIEQHYDFVRIEDTKESGTNIGGPIGNPGTRVETLEDEVYGRFIGVATFEPDGYFYETCYYLRWRSDRP